MIFNEDTRAKLDAIIHGAALGETVGLLASRMSEVERAEKLMQEGILQLSRQSDLTSTSGELLKATVSGLEAAEVLGNPSNLEIRTQLHNAYREWVRTSPTSLQFRNIHLVRAINSGSLGSFSSVERGGCDGMLMVAPIGLAFSDDPGRAFQVGAETAALLDADFNGFLSAGVVSLLFALMEQGISIKEAIADILSFIRPLDWPGEISNVLRSVRDCEALSGCYSHPACADLRGTLAFATTTETLWTSVARVAVEGGPVGSLILLAQLSGAADD